MASNLPELARLTQKFINAAPSAWKEPAKITSIKRTLGDFEGHLPIVNKSDIAPVNSAAPNMKMTLATYSPPN